MKSRGRALGGHLPHRVVRGRGLTGLPAPDPEAFTEFDLGSRGQAVSTTMAFAGLLRNLLRDPAIGKHVVPIIPDEARTFGMDALFKEFKIYAPVGQLYEPVDSKLMLSYSEAKDGPDPRGGHHRGGRHGRLHGGRDRLRHMGPAHGAVLHVLFDVRVPARRRPDLGSGRHPGDGAF